MFLIPLLVQYLLLTPTTALPSTNISTSTLASHLQALVPQHISCFDGTGAHLIPQVQCINAMNDIVRDADFIRDMTYDVDHYALIKSWHQAPCTIIVFRDAEERPPPHTLTFSYMDAFHVVLQIFRRCEETGYGGLAEVGNGYAVSVGNPIRPDAGGAGAGHGVS